MLDQRLGTTRFGERAVAHSSAAGAVPDERPERSVRPDTFGRGKTHR